ncbi:MAG: SdpI family protein [Clostridia bacterium]|nr:SdpI family protein [Clostridia bacterium]
MLKKNKFKIIISSAIILLPALFGVIMWNELPHMMATHWGADGVADRASGKIFTIFGIPLIFLLIHFICLFFTLNDQKQREQNSKALNVIFWIIPFLSLFTNGLTYSVALGKELDFNLLLPVLLGIFLIFTGNYLPKTKQNKTFGIKVFWTLCNQENWNKTHRFGGKIWVIGGLLMMLCAFLPFSLMFGVTMCILMAAIIAPVFYSFLIYRKHRKEGIEYKSVPCGKKEKTAIKISAFLGIIILCFATVLMFTGKIQVYCEDTFFKINATYWFDVKTDYSEIDTIEYRDYFDTGFRKNGFGSAKLSMGIFQNDEFGSYTLYAYTDAKEFIVLKSDENILVIGMKNAQETRKIYDTLTKRTYNKQ